MKKVELEEIELDTFSSEREMQEMIGYNLKQIFNLDFLCFEFGFGPPNNSGKHRIDILAFDNESKSFVIIECKKKNVHNAIGQGRRYSNLIMDYRNDFYAKYQDLRGNAATRLREIRWQDAKLILVAAGYDDNQKISAKNDLRVDLWEVRKHKNNTISFKWLDKSFPEDNSKYVIFDMQEKAHPNSSGGENLSESPKEGYATSDQSLTEGEQKHLAEVRDDEIKVLYNKLRNGILAFGDIKIISRSKVVSYFVAKSRIASIAIQQRQLKMSIHMRKGELYDPENEMRDISGVGSWTGADYEKVVTSDISNETLERILNLVEQSLTYHSNKKKAYSQNKDLPQKTMNRRSIINKQPKKIKRTEEEHFEGRAENLVDLYKEFKFRILNLSGTIKIKVRGTYIGFDTHVNIASIEFMATQLVMWINMSKGKLTDSMEITRDVSEVGHHGQGHYQVNIDSHENMEHILDMVKQSLNYEGKRKTAIRRKR